MKKEKKRKKERELSTYGIIKRIVLLIFKNVTEAVERWHSEPSYHSQLV